MNQLADQGISCPKHSSVKCPKHPGVSTVPFEEYTYFRKNLTKGSKCRSWNGNIDVPFSFSAQPSTSVRARPVAIPPRLHLFQFEACRPTVLYLQLFVASLHWNNSKGFPQDPRTRAMLRYGSQQLQEQRGLSWQPGSMGAFQAKSLTKLASTAVPTVTNMEGSTRLRTLEHNKLVLKTNQVLCQHTNNNECRSWFVQV